MPKKEKHLEGFKCVHPLWKTVLNFKIGPCSISCYSEIPILRIHHKSSLLPGFEDKDFVAELSEY